MGQSKSNSKFFIDPKLVITLFIVLPVIGYYLGTQSQNKLPLQRQDELSSIKEELNLCIQNKGKVAKSYKLSYPIQGLSVNSSLFEGKELNIREWSYKGNTIKEYSIEILRSDSQTNPIEIKIWDFLNVVYPYQATFDNAGNAVSVSNFDNAQSLKYMGSTKVTWSRFYGELSSRKDTTSIHTIYVQIIGDQVTGLPNKDWQYYVNSSTKELEPIADKINF